MRKIILLLTVCYLKLVYCDERRDLNNLFSLPDFNHSLSIATGEWIESCTDYETVGPHPLTLKRLFCPSTSHSDELTPEWKFSLPHFSSGGIPILEWQGYNFVYNSQRQLVQASNRFGNSVKIERPDPNRIDLIVSNNRRIQYQFETIQNSKRLAKVKRPGMADRTYAYVKGSQANQLLLKRRDETNGRFLEWQHDERGRVIKTIAPAGTTQEPKTILSIKYHLNQTEVQETSGYRKVYTFTPDHHITKIEHYLDCLIKSEELIWSHDSLIEHKILDNKGRLLACRSLEYDSHNRLIKETWEGALTDNHLEKTCRTLRYDNEDRLIYEEEEEGKSISYGWDKKNLVVKKEGSIETHYKYNSDDLLVEEKLIEGADVRLTLIGYNLQGLPETVSKFYNGCLLETKSFTYTKEGWVSSEITENLTHVSSLVYERDIAGRILSSTNEKGETETFSYDAHGNILTHNSLNETKEMSYDFMNRLIGERDKASYTYDLQGNTLSKSDEYGNSTLFEYDALGRVIKVIEPLVITLEGAQNPITTYEYDLFDRVTKKIDPMGNVTCTQYNLRGQPTEILYPDQTFEKYEYTKSGKLRRKLSRDNSVHEYDYDINGRMIHYQERYQANVVQAKTLQYSLDKVISEETLKGILIPQYASDGSLKSVSMSAADGSFIIETPDPKSPSNDPPEIDFKIEKSKVVNRLGQWVLQTTHTTENGLKIVKEFDALNRVVTIKKFDPLGQLVIEREKIYDLNGEIVRETSQGISNQYTRKPGGKITEMIEACDTPAQRKTSFYYDENSNLTNLVKPDGISLSFKYERHNLIKLISSDGSVHYHFHYDGDQLVQVDDLILNQTATRTFNALNLITKETLLNGLKIEYNYDESGRPISLKLPDESLIAYHYEGEVLAQVSRRDKNNLEQYHHTLLNPATEEMILGLGTLETLRDDEGRISSISSPFRKESYEYESDLKAIWVDGKITHQFAYDAFHRLVQDNDEALSYDDRNNLETMPNCRLKHDELNRVVCDGYRYDLNGNLIENPRFKFKYDALNRLVEVKNGDAIIIYTYDPFNRRMSRNETTFFWDGREEIGSFKEKIQDLKVVANGRMIACEIEGLPFAVQTDFKNTPVLYINTTSTKTEGPFALQGKRLDPETGFVYFGARDYDPVLHRFISCDPKGYVDGFNLYHYAHNNPNRYFDLFGHTSILEVFKEPISYGMYALKSIYGSLTSLREWINNFSGLGTAYKYMQETAEILLGKGFISLAGAYNQESQTGLFGKGEMNDKVRITFIHGILNIRSDLIDNLRQLSQSHGGVNIHYLFRPTQGFAWDILKCISIKFGFVSSESRELVRIWKSLIEEMGGTGGGGKIIHYAHSLGGTDTFTALSYLTPEEQSMIDIRTLGSATLIPQEGHYSVINYVSLRDGVSYFDPFRYVKALFNSSNIIFIGTLWGLPLKDHPLSVDSYQGIIRALGQAFIESYG